MAERHLRLVHTNLRPHLSSPNPAAREKLHALDGGLADSTVTPGAVALRRVLTEADLGAVMMDVTPIDDSLPARVERGVFIDAERGITNNILASSAQNITSEFARKNLPIDINAARMREALLMVGDVLEQGIVLGEHIDNLYFRTSPSTVYGEDVARAVVARDVLSWLAASMARGADTALPKELGEFLDDYPSAYWTNNGVANSEKVRSTFQCLARGLSGLFGIDERAELVGQLDDARMMLTDVSGITPSEYNSPEALQKAWDVYLGADEIPPAS